MKITKYPDGSGYVTVKGVGNLGRWDTGETFPQRFTFRVNTYEDLHYLEQVVDVYNHHNLHPHITIPNLIDAQADRRFGEDKPHGLRIVCRRLNSMKATFEIFHPHNPEVVEALIDNVKIMDNKYFITKVITGIDRTYKNSDKNPHKDLVLMSADAGGFKPLTKLCDDIKWGGQIHSCSKGRSYDGTKSTLTQRIGKEDFLGKDILIIDDISVRGGTFKGLAKLLKQRNCGKLYLAVSHMTVQDLGQDPVTNYFDKVFTTNSKFNDYYTYYGSPNRHQPENLEVIKLFNDEDRS